MIDQNQIKQQIEKILSLLGVEGSISIEDRAGKIVFNIKSPDSRLLIGQSGGNLLSFQHIVRLLIRKQMGEEEYKKTNFIIDIDDYRKNRDQYLEDIAQQAAQRLRQTREPVILKPMNSYERYVIHSFLANEADLQTESIDEGEERRVIIKNK